jgi:Bacterial pre-peptidase C-terminal domain
MVRGFLASVLWLPVAGCSLILDFSDKAVPKDAPADTPYTQAECDYKEPNESAATAALITPADTGPAAICAGGAADRDFYKFTVPDGTTKVEIRISTTYRPGGDLDLRLYDKNGLMLLAQSNNFSNDETIVCPAASPSCALLAAGDYVFEVFPAITGAVNAYTIALTITP